MGVESYRRPDRTGPPIPCACGCGTEIASLDARGRPRQWAHGHHRTGKSNTWKVKPDDEINWTTVHERARKALRDRGALGCQLFRIGGCKGDIHVHHLDENPWNNDPANLEVLCRAHHFLVHHGRIDMTDPVMPSFRTGSDGKRRYR